MHSTASMSRLLTIVLLLTLTLTSQAQVIEEPINDTLRRCLS